MNINKCEIFYNECVYEYCGYCGESLILFYLLKINYIEWGKGVKI